MNTIQMKRSSEQGKVPTPSQLAVGEFAVNLVDRKLFTKTEQNTVVEITPEATSVGMVAWFALDNAPPGYLKANGQTVSRSTFSALFMAIGTRFGTGDGMSTFNVPNLQDRMSIGAGNLYGVGHTGGNKDAIVVSHSHSMSDPGHRHNTTLDGGVVGTSRSYQAQAGLTTYSTADGGYESYWARGTPDSTQANASTSSTATTGMSISSTGSSGANANLPPYVAMLACIKY